MDPYHFTTPIDYRLIPVNFGQPKQYHQWSFLYLIIYLFHLCSITTLMYGQIQI